MNHAKALSLEKWRRSLARFLCCLLLASTISTAEAADCPGNPHAIGPSRVVSLDAHSFRGGNLQDLLADKELVLSFDDGPLPPSTDKILKVLKAECVQATFFIVGEMANDSPEEVLRAARAGHTIGTHTQTHPHLRALPLDLAFKEIDDGMASTKRALGNAAKIAPFFRPPYLEITPEIKDRLNDHGIVVWDFGWLFDDWTQLSVDELVARVVRRAEDERKGVIILHDIWPVTARALPRLLKELKQRGFHIVHVTWDTQRN
jgi:peptidoglycan/xylan/chitin deacetylase (PgdA/CDA1 family)